MLIGNHTAILRSFSGYTYTLKHNIDTDILDCYCFNSDVYTSCQFLGTYKQISTTHCVCINVMDLPTLQGVFS